ncbi:terminase [Arthrobacter roseus]|uniref:terminase n=1 Tax=Arthrobacter roseus TaxID=136274 RepID=UPI001964EB7C|nr:terminase [Arthrobacter roseus]MBM7847472.1 hypothetical protein [Arthrobacter roseus]
MTNDLSLSFSPSETLGFLGADWIEAHCSVPDGFDKGAPFVPSTWQLFIIVNHYRIKRAVKFVPSRPILAPAFTYRRSQCVAPQKTGKGPLAAAVTLLEAAGPIVFGGWAVGGEVYDCRDHGCGCGFIYEYEPGDAMGIPRNTSLIQLVATSEEQVDNVYRPLQSMVRGGPLAEIMKTGEQFVRLPNDGKIEAVTSSAQSRLGNPINFANFDESGIYTIQNKMVRVAETMRRGLAGMGGRSIEWTNPWDPSENSTAQRTSESKSTDIFRFYRKPPADLSYKNKAERHKIHKYVYEGSPWVDLNAIEAEAAELMETDPAQAERFYGNRIVHGLGAWLKDGIWEGSYAGNALVAQS